MPTASLTFAGMLLGVILIVGALSYLVVLSLGSHRRASHGGNVGRARR